MGEQLRRQGWPSPDVKARNDFRGVSLSFTCSRQNVNENMCWITHSQVGKILTCFLFVLEDSLVLTSRLHWPYVPSCAAFLSNPGEMIFHVLEWIKYGEKCSHRVIDKANKRIYVIYTSKTDRITDFMYYLNTKAGSLSCALSWSTSLGKSLRMENEGIPSSPHSFSVESCISKQTEFSDWITDWT